MRKVRYLIAGLASLAKPFFLGALAVGIGLSDSGGFASFYLRYLIFAHVVPSVCFFFLYLDEEKYRIFRPLVALLAAGSVLFLAAALFPAAANPQKLLLAAKDAQGLSKSAMAYFATLLIDILCMVVLIPGATSRADRKIAAVQDGNDATLPNKEK